jgi:hypothetical protein
MALCYNFSRVLSILGLGRWLSALTMRIRKSSLMLFVAIFAPPHRLSRTTAATYHAFHIVLMA